MFEVMLPGLLEKLGRSFLVKLDQMRFQLRPQTVHLLTRESWPHPAKSQGCRFPRIILIRLINHSYQKVSNIISPMRHTALFEWNCSIVSTQNYQIKSIRESLNVLSFQFQPRYSSLFRNIATWWVFTHNAFLIPLYAFIEVL